MAQTQTNNLLAFIAELPNVSRMDSQPTQEQCDFLIKSYGTPLVEDTLLAMENQRGIQKKYTSVYLTCRAWCKRSLSYVNTTPKFVQ